MKNNLRKILSGLALVAMTTGCGLTKHSSPADSSPADSSPAANSSSETPSSSVNDSSSTGPVDTYEVSEDEWKAAMDLTNYTNVTVDLEMDMNASDPLSDFLSESAAGTATLKASDGKAFVSKTTNNTLEFDKATMAEWTLEALQQAYPDYNLTAEDITSEMVKEYVGLLCSSALELDVAAEDITETENAYCVVYRSSSMEAYVAKANDDLIDLYEYYDEVESFVKLRTFGDFNGVIAEFLDSGCFLADKYSAAEFDEDTNKYYLGTDVLARDFGLGANDTVDIYYSFLNGKLTSVDFALSYAEDGMNITETYSYTFKDYGATSVTLPAAESVYACEHEETYEGYNEDYHYTVCAICGSVIEYEAHTFDADDCTECGYYPTSKETSTIADFEVTIFTNDHNGQNTYISLSYDDENNDFETGNIIYTSESTTNYVVLSTKEELVDAETCLYKYTYTFSFYDENDNEVADSISYVEYDNDHSYGAPEEYMDGCYREDTYTCTECGHVEKASYYSHRVGEPIYGEKDDQCNVHYTVVCPDCGEIVEEGDVANHAFSISLTGYDAEKEIYSATLTCSDCGKSFKGTCSFSKSWDYPQYCEMWFSDGENSFTLYVPHSYEEGECVLCGALEPHYCEGEHTSVYIMPYEFEGSLGVGIYGCDNCDYQEEVYIQLEDLGNGKHSCTILNAEGEVIAFEESEDHYSANDLPWMDLDGCPCGGTSDSGSTEEHTHSYYVKDVTMIDVESGTATLCCEDCDYEREYAFTVTNMDPNTHQFFDSGEDNWVNFSAPHDFSNGDCYCGAKAPATDGHYCEGDHTSEKFIIIDTADGQTGTANHYCEDCDYNERVSFVVISQEGSTFTLECTRGDGSTFTYILTM